MFAPLIGLLALAATSILAIAQQVEFSTFRFFEGDSVDVNADALNRLANTIRRANVPNGCPLGRLKIRVAEGDPLFQVALAAARRDVILGRLDQMGIPVAGRLFVETSIFGGTEGDDAVYEIPVDRAPPTLQTNSTPPSGSKVTAKQRIVVRMTARDDGASWQTGIKSIQLVADSDGGRFIASENYPACSEPKEKRVEATYEVPADPPAVVRLSAIAEDHAGNKSEIDRAEFPTGDWRGTYDSHNPSNGPHQTRIRADIVLHHDSKGNLTGTMVGQQEMISASVGGCSHRMKQPNRFRITLAGAYTDKRVPKITMKDLEESKLIVEVLCDGTPPQQYDTSIVNYVPYGHIEFFGPLGMLGEGVALPDGSRRYQLDTGTATFALTLRRTSN